jgi:hypothetical protein
MARIGAWVATPFWPTGPESLAPGTAASVRSPRASETTLDAEYAHAIEASAKILRAGTPRPGRYWLAPERAPVSYHLPRSHIY